MPKVWDHLPSGKVVVHISIPRGDPLGSQRIPRLADLIGRPRQLRAINAPSFLFPDRVPSGNLTVCYGKSPFLMGKSTISMAIFNSYVSLPEGNHWIFNRGDEKSEKNHGRPGILPKVPTYICWFESGKGRFLVVGLTDFGAGLVSFNG